MKKCLFFIFTLVIVSCTDQFSVNEVTGELVEQVPVSEVSALMERARWGDGEAYVKLADCYRDGRGVRQDFISMLGMVSFADEYGGINCMEDYISSLPAMSEYKLVFDAMDKFSRGNLDETLAAAEELMKTDCIEGYTLKGVVLTERGSVEEGKRLLEFAAKKGSGFAELYLCIPDWQHAQIADVAKLAALTDRMPIANACLGKIYSGRGGESLEDKELAAYYYMKADENACLSRDGARWLLSYYRNGGKLVLSERDTERLEILTDMKASITETEEVEEIIEIVDTVTVAK